MLIDAGFQFTEGPQWVRALDALLFSDIPNDRILRWDETNGVLSDFRRPSNHANGLARDRQGRLLACEWPRPGLRLAHQ